MSTFQKVIKRTAIAGGSIVGIPLGASILYAWKTYNETPQDQISKLHTPYSIYVQSLTNVFMKSLAKKGHEKFERSCENAAKENEKLLLELLQRHGKTVYGQDYGLEKYQSREEFRSKHPITRLEHYESYIDQIVNISTKSEKQNEVKTIKNVLFPEEPRMIAESSGTSGGKRKLIPVPPLQRKVFFTDGIAITFHALMEGVSVNDKQWPNLQKSCKLMREPKYTYTNHPDPKQRIKIGPNSSNPKDNKALLELYTTPNLAFEIQNESDIMFLHALYALLDRNLGFIESNFANRVFNFFVLIEDRWDDLLGAIEYGKLPQFRHDDDNYEESDHNTSSSHRNEYFESVRKQLESELKPNPGRANELRTIKAKYDNANKSNKQSSLAKQIWPNLHTILAVETGAFQIYGEKLRKYWIGYDGDIQIYSPLYAASEGLIGVNPNMKDKTYVLNPNVMFFEFIPMDAEGNDIMSKDAATLQPKTLFIEQLEVGKEYELIVTTLTGLYRYELGDVIRCVGYKGKAPIVEFAYRKGQFLNVCGERTSEESFYKALTKTVSEDWNLQLLDYTTVDYSNVTQGRDRKPKYTVFVEVSDDLSGGKRGTEKGLHRREMRMLDKRLGRENSYYSAQRRLGKLESVEVVVVQRGTFDKIREKLILNGIGATQMKQPRVLKNPELIEILEENKL